MIVGIFCVVLLFLLCTDEYENYPNAEDENWLENDVLCRVY